MATNYILLENLHYLTIGLTLLYVGSYAMSTRGWQYWGFDFFNNFKVQYFFSGIVLWGSLLFFEDYFYSVVVLGITIAAYLDTRGRYFNKKRLAQPEAKKGAKIFSVMVFNKYYYNKKHKKIIRGLSEYSKDIDFVLMIEALDHEVPVFCNALKEYFPYNLPENEPRPDFVQVFSKFPVTHYEIRNLTGAEDIHEDSSYGIRMHVQAPDWPDPVIIYSTHGASPFGKKLSAKQFRQFKTISEWIAADPHKNILFMGDWNTTPYGNVFKSVLGISKLKFQNFGVLPETTWPSWAFFPFLKIPIDHILFSDALRLIGIQKGKSMGSDHHCLCARFELPDEEIKA